MDERFGFGVALERLKSGGRVRLAKWEPGAFIYLVPGSTFVVSRDPLLSILGNGTKVSYSGHIDISWRLKNGELRSGVWTPTQCELLSEDWEAA